jgi:hypothetical protein
MLRSTTARRSTLVVALPAGSASNDSPPPAVRIVRMTEAKEPAMTPVVAVKLEVDQRRQLARTGSAIREAIALLWERPALDHIREPAGLEHPPTQRSRRLMRNARAGGW